MSKLEQRPGNQGNFTAVEVDDILYFIVNPEQVEYRDTSGGERRSRGTSALYFVQLAYSYPKLLVWSPSAEAAIEDAAGWAADNASGALVSAAEVREAEEEGWIDDLYYTESGYLNSDGLYYSEVLHPNFWEAGVNTENVYAAAVEASLDWCEETWGPSENSIVSVEVVDLVNNKYVQRIRGNAVKFDKLLQKYGNSDRYRVQGINRKGSVVVDNGGIQGRLRKFEAR